MQSIITLENLSRSYNIYGENGEVTSKAEALKDVKFEITEGSFTAILGANGSGKSTLAKIFSAILKPSKGTVSVAGLVVGSDLQNKDEQNSVNDDIIYEIRKNAGMVFQNPDNQLIASVVEEDIAFGLENLGIERGEMRRRIDDVMKTVGIYELRKRAPHHLSGGQKQRVAIAGILAMQPKILILDEPTAMLDPTGRAEVMKTAIALNKEKGITIVLITHYMEEAALADRIIVMNKGEVALDGTPKEVFRQEKLVKLYGLDVPQVTEFTHALIEKNDKFSQIPDDIISEDECVELLRKNKILVGASVLEDNIIKHKESRKSENILQTEKLVYKYGRGTPDETMALKEISLSIEKGEFIGIIGHTGSGKSTLIQTFNGLLKPHGGKILVGGRDIWGKVDKKDKKNNSIREIRFKVGLIFQYSEHQLFGETVAKDIAYGPTNMGLLESEVRERVKKAAELVGLDSELMKRSPFDLSGGQQRRVALAGVLAMEPEVLVLDEPAAGLDPLGRENMLDIIKKYHTDGHTVILVSHSMEDIVRYAEKTLVMRGGDIFMFDKTENVFARSDELSDVGLNLPQITRVFEKLGVKGVYTVERAVDLIQC